MRALLFTALAVVGCTKQNPDFCPAHPDDPRCGDGMGSDGGADGPDAYDPTIDARLDFGGGNYTVHVTSGPAMPSISFNPGAQLDTSASNLCLSYQPWTGTGQPDACFVYANNIMIQDGLDVIGSRPLVLLAAGSITINGLVDVASHLGGTTTTKVAPGSNPAACKPFAQAPGTNGVGGGGAGGSFITVGGDGGTGNSAAAGKAATADQLAPMVLRGGCDGQTGAQGSMNTPGEKGRGGGAVFLLAGNAITLSGTTIINVSGSGGGVASKSSGGGGGGSGGMIVLHAMTINAMDAKLVANGGSGSTGSNNGSGTIGNDPVPSTPTAQASGPTGSGGAGGAGFGGGNDATNGGSSSNGGGGGGGASGYIQSSVALTGAIASPTVVNGGF